MAYFDSRGVDDFPFEGLFYTTTIDTSVDLDEQTETEVVILRTKCDITEASHARVNGSLNAMYAVFVPFCKRCEGVKINRGDLFRANVYGLLVKGKVEGVFPSTEGGFVCYVQTNEIANKNQ